jgi:tetratricopeptide (TPR) repeat protein
LNEAIRLNPTDVDAYHNRGLSYALLGQYEKAIEDYNEAIRLDPTMAGAYHNRGLAYQAIGNPKKAEMDFQRYLDLGGE